MEKVPNHLGSNQVSPRDQAISGHPTRHSASPLTIDMDEVLSHRCILTKWLVKRRGGLAFLVRSKKQNYQTTRLRLIFITEVVEPRSFGYTVGAARWGGAPTDVAAKSCLMLLKVPMFMRVCAFGPGCGLAYEYSRVALCHAAN
ncbi:hypothetical protein U1Q18_044997 [Sarracenia purpurea var. burkii]